MTRATSFLVLAAVLSATSALPFQKRIAQTIADSTTDWVQACTAAGGADKCQPISQTAFMTLLAAAGPCDQQNAADQMVDLAKQLNNDANMIKFAQIFAQQPRNSPDSTQVPYCQQAPANSELNGLFQCQFQGTTDTFNGGLQAGAAGTVPFGLNSLATARSCPANPSGGITDGSQLTDTTQDPGLANIASIGSGSGSGGASNSTASGTAASGASSSSAVASPAASSTAAAGGGGSCSAADTTAAAATATATSAAASSSSSGSTSGSGSSFALSNGQAAQKLNAQFATLTASSSCNAGDNACVGSSFAQCVDGKFQLSDCGSSSGLTCAALPLVNSQGTSITCTTQADAEQRIAATGATGGITGSN